MSVRSPSRNRPFAILIDWRFLLIVVLYVVTRWNHLSRELASEEGYFIIPGRNFFEHFRYSGYYGETISGLTPANPFHKPPLTSLLLGLFSFLSPDGVVGARLLPFAIGLFVVMMPLVLTGTIIPSLLLLASPFIYATASHMQTDSTVGILGYCFVMWFWIRQAKGQLSPWLLYAGAATLWLGKLEITCIAMAASLLLFTFVKSEVRKNIFKKFVLANLVGLLLFLLVCGLLGFSAGYELSESAGYVVSTVLRISGHLAESQAARRGDALWTFFKNFGGPLTVLLFVVPLGWVLLEKRFTILKEKETMRYFWITSLFAVLPMTVYLAGGYAGDGFPRYLIIAVVPLGWLCGFALQALSRTQRTLASCALLVWCSLTLLPQFTSLWKEPGVVTVPRLQVGLRDAVVIAQAKTPPHGWILGPDRGFWYARDRHWLTTDSFEPYPDLHENALKSAGLIDAVVLPKSDFDRHPPDIIAELILKVRQNLKNEFDVGNFRILTR